LPACQVYGQALDEALCDTVADQLQVLLPDEIEALLLYLSLDPTAFSNAYNELLGRLNSRNLRLPNSPVQAPQLVELMHMLRDGRISGKIGKAVMDEMFASGEGPGQIVKRLGLGRISDPAELLPIVHP